MKKTLFAIALVACAITTVTADAACRRGCRNVAVRYAAVKNCARRTAQASNRRPVSKRSYARPQTTARRVVSGCANGNCSF